MKQVAFQINTSRTSCVVDTSYTDKQGTHHFASLGKETTTIVDTTQDNDASSVPRTRKTTSNSQFGSGRQQEMEMKPRQPTSLIVYYLLTIHERHYYHEGDIFVRSDVQNTTHMVDV